MNRFISLPPRDPWKPTHYQYVENHVPGVVRSSPWHTVTASDIVGGAITAYRIIDGDMSRIIAVGPDLTYDRNNRRRNEMSNDNRNGTGYAPASDFRVERVENAYSIQKGIKSGDGYMAIMHSTGERFITPDEADQLCDMIHAYANWLRTATPTQIESGAVTYLN